MLSLRYKTKPANVTKMLSLRYKTKPANVTKMLSLWYKTKPANVTKMLSLRYKNKPANVTKILVKKIIALAAMFWDQCKTLERMEPFSANPTADEALTVFELFGFLIILWGWRLKG